MIVHGDLTTSNILIESTNNNEIKLVLIDFGLSQTSNKSEDIGVDLYVLGIPLLFNGLTLKPFNSKYINTKNIK